MRNELIKLQSQNKVQATQISRLTDQLIHYRQQSGLSIPTDDEKFSLEFLYFNDNFKSIKNELRMYKDIMTGKKINH